MRKRHASQYANFGSLQLRMKNDDAYSFLIFNYSLFTHYSLNIRVISFHFSCEVAPGAAFWNFAMCASHSA